MNLNIFSELDFLPALHTFFENLSIPIHHIADEPTTAKEILIENHKENDTFALTNDVYFVGMVDDAAFEKRKSSLELKDIETDYDGILIFGITLHERPNGLLPTRTQLAEIARAFNREFYYTPVVVVFKYANHIAFANTERLQYKQEWREGEKAGKVTLLRDVNIEKPHAGHQRILAELKIPTTGRDKVDSFAKLYTYWQEVLSVNILNKRFYEDLSNWYFWAVKEVQFPGAPTFEEAHVKGRDLEDLKQEHKATNVIRMLTRLLFVWFLKEKKLIPSELFDLKALQDDILNDINPVKQNGLFKEQNIDSIYYKAILQNLFFATLNCPIEGDSIDKRKRGFRSPKSNYGTMFLMRYEKYFKDKDAFLEMVNQTVPFLNGGLFECLDERGEGEKKDERKWVDGFSDNLPKEEHLVVPDYLFFGNEEHIDLSDVVGIDTREFREADVKGLIKILESYKFTITENTPIEEDVALDPELLGRVFENLLASYNPETKTTARKQTGSFYTPREIVNYMVDESLIAYLTTTIDSKRVKAVEPTQEPTETWRQLISFDPGNPFSEDKALTKDIITALSTCTILDPACGSGAFPMGILQKMVHILQKLDPSNEIWQEVQFERADEESKNVFGQIEDEEGRQERLDEIYQAFDQTLNDPDYARKLFLIENCIFGVDIQPIATQISKLRFFISLVVDQKVNPEKNNFGIRALPNLETKFVTANTLIGIDRPQKGDQLNMFSTEKLQQLEAELKIVRSKLFSAKTRATKVKYRNRDEELRNEISAELIEIGWETDTAQKLAGWDPYDQNASSSFFDPEWMFDIKEGFDVVIGNPPYIGERKNKHVFLPIQESTNSKYYLGRMDYFYFFFHLSLDLMAKKGHCCFITTNYFITALGARKLRADIKKRASIKTIVNFNEAKVFDSAAGQHNMITLLSNGKQNIPTQIKLNHFKGLLPVNDLKSFLDNNNYKLIYPKDIWDGEENYLRLSGIGQDSSISKILNVIKEKSTDLLGNICKPLIGLESSLDSVYVRDVKFFKSIIKDEYEMEFVKPFFKNSDIERYKVRKETERAILYLHEKIPQIEELKGIYNYLLENETEIKSRKGANLRGAFRRGNWWVLNTPRLDMDFNDEKIVTPYRSKENTFAYTNEPWYASRDVYYIIKQKPNIHLKYILALLNSRLYFHWFYHRGKRKGNMLEMYAKPLKEVPIIEVDNSIQSIFTLLVDFITFIASNNESLDLVDLIIEGCVVELFFSDHMKLHDINLLDFVEQDIKNTLQGREFENLTDKQQQNVIEQLHATWTNPNNEVVKRMSMFREKSPDILGVILDS